MCIIPRKRLTPLPGDFSVDRGINRNLAENSVSILFVGDGFPVPLHSGLFTASPNPFGRFSRLLREAKRLPYALQIPNLPFCVFSTVRMNMRFLPFFCKISC